ncbi:LEA type 2 family protein [Aurantibacter sp.]|uniref:LEA type 2 family protein n=1 Tax=Aurantibacter sp. TaxID=2807103 RepID=UPI0035C78C4E
MKHLLILSTLFLTIFSCTVNKKPEFISVKNIEVTESTSKLITVTADALFSNPNDVSGDIETEGMIVFVNGNEIAHVSSDVFKVPAKKDFTIPLTAKIPTDSLFSNNNLGGLLGSLFSKKIKVQYKGDIKYKVFGFSHTYAVDKTEDVKLKF